MLADTRPAIPIPSLRWTTHEINHLLHHPSFSLVQLFFFFVSLIVPSSFLLDVSFFFSLPPTPHLASGAGLLLVHLSRPESLSSVSESDLHLSLRVAFLSGSFIDTTVKDARC